jgi:hypothetical protein
MKTLKTISKICLVALFLQTTNSSLFAQNTAWSTVNPIGIGTTSPTAGYKLHVNGDFKISNSPANTNYVHFEIPGGENGMSFRQGAGPRCDIRFNGTVLRLITNTAAGVPLVTNGINIKTNGFVGIGNDDPTYRLNVNDNTNADYGSWISANSKGPALFVRRDNVGTTTGGGSYTTSQQYALVVEEATGTAGIGCATFRGLDGDGIEIRSSNTGILSSQFAKGTVLNLYGILSQAYNQSGATVTNSNGITHNDYFTAQNSSCAIRGNSQGNVSAFGVYGSAGSNQSAYGIYGTASGAVTSWAGYFVGQVFSTGGFITSDEKLKENVKDMTSPLDIIMKLSPKTYNYKQSDEFLGLNLPKGEKYGLIAQELEKVLPELVKTSINPEVNDMDGKIISRNFEFKTVDYTSLIPFLIGGMKEQQEKIEILQERITAITGESFTGVDSRTSGINKSILYQNNPNPFNEGTTIKYELASNISQGQIMVFDMTGAIITKYEVDTKTKTGEIKISANELKPGMYIYSLIVDKKEVDTKRMIIDK